ncbi:MAG TPA: arylsulfatase [bacterium]|nr:arylsulfatase [bacterium]
MNNRIVSRRHFLRTVGLATLSVTAAGLYGRAQNPMHRPNILLILADDMGYSDLGCYGGEINTPHLDSLAEQGLQFTQFYNNAKCAPTRASVLTGLYHRRPPGPLLRENMVTLGEVLKQAGYQTALTGKWHLGSEPPRRPIDRGFDEYYGLMDGCCNYFDPAQPDPPFKGGRVRVFGHNDHRITEFPNDFYTTDAFTDHAIHTLKQFAGRTETFFIHLCYTAPHYPLHAWPEDIAKYRGQYKMGWYELRRLRHQRQLEMGLIDPEWDLPKDDFRARNWDTADQDYEDLRMAVYAAMVDRMDQNIGRLLQALKESGEEENTLVLFLSDNGGCAEEPEGPDYPHPPGPKEYYTSVGPSWGWAQNTPFRRYKQWDNEGGIATPLIVRWPRVIQANTRTDQVGHIIDFMPTFLELARARYPKSFQGKAILPLEGKSLVPIVHGKKREGHEVLFWEFGGNRAVRVQQGKWKLVWDRTIEEWELYDIDTDRTEMHNLANNHPEQVRKMVSLYSQWADKVGVKL